MTNKILKFFLFLFFSVFSIATALYINKLQLDATTRQRYDIGTSFSPFNMPDRTKTVEEEEIIQSILQKVSNDMQLNYLKRVTDYTAAKHEDNLIDIAKDEIAVTYYTFTVTPTSLLEQFGEEKKLIDTSMLLTTKNLTSQTNSLEKNSSEVSFTIKDISKANEEFIGSYFLEVTDQAIFEQYLTSVAKIYNQKFNTNFQLSSFQDNTLPETLELTTYSQITSMLIYALIFMLLFLIAWLFENTKVIAVCSLNGFHTFSIAKKILLRTLFFFSFVLGFIIQIVIFSSFNLLYTSFQIILTFMFFSITCLIISLMKKISLSNQLNKKSYSTRILPVLYGFKLLLLIICFSFVTPLTELFLLTIGPDQTESLAYDDYGVFYPTYVGKDFKELMNNSNPNHGISDNLLYNYLDEQGALLIDTSNYYQQTREIDQSIIVNPNYLDKYPVLSADGKPIKIDSNESSKIVFIPEKYIDMYKEIREEYAGFYNQSADTIQFYLIQNQQRIYTLNPENELIVTPNIIEVQTKTNSSSNQRTFITGGGTTDPMKIKLTDDVLSTYKSLSPLIKSINKDDNYISLLPISKLKKANIQIQLGEIYRYLLEVLFSVILVCSLIGYTAFVYFKVNKKKFAILKLNGISFFRIYQNILIATALQYVIIFTFILFQYSIHSLISALFFLLIESTILVALLINLERKNIANTLGGK